MTRIDGIPVIASDVLPDGEYRLTPDALIVGTGPVDWLTWCDREAKRIVQTGLADVLAWLGEPAWQPPMSSQRFFEAVARG